MKTSLASLHSSMLRKKNWTLLLENSAMDDWIVPQLWLQSYQTQEWRKDYISQLKQKYSFMLQHLCSILTPQFHTHDLACEVCMHILQANICLASNVKVNV